MFALSFWSVLTVHVAKTSREGPWPSAARRYGSRAWRSKSHPSQGNHREPPHKGPCVGPFPDKVGSSDPYTLPRGSSRLFRRVSPRREAVPKGREHSQSIRVERGILPIAFVIRPAWCTRSRSLRFRAKSNSL
jgi:hypothetical protein